MAGLGTVSENRSTYLSVAGGFIWNRKAEQDDPDYATQKYTKADKTEGTRAGARYADITGNVIDVKFRTHDEYGESINVMFEAGEETYIISISTNNRYSQDMMKALLKMDLEKEIYMKPYDFIGNDKKRAMGLSFRQDGVKLNLRVEGAPQKDTEWFKTANKKQIKRFFEDLNDWFVAEVEEKICPLLSQKQVADKPKTGLGSAATEESSPVDPVEETKVEKKVAETSATDEIPKATPLKMKKFLKEFIAENYPGKELPNLSKDELKEWYELAYRMEELPFPDEDIMPGAEVAESDLDVELNNLMK